MISGAGMVGFRRGGVWDEEGGGLAGVCRKNEKDGMGEALRCEGARLVRGEILRVAPPRGSLHTEKWNFFLFFPF